MVKRNINALEAPKEETINVNDLKFEVLEFAKKQIEVDIDREIKKANEKYIKEMKRKIFYLRVIIVLLVFGYLITIGWLVKDHYFDKYMNKTGEMVIDNNEKENDKKENKTVEPEIDPKKEEEKRQEELREKYNDIFEGFRITKGISNLEDYYDNNYSTQLLMEIAAENSSYDYYEIDDDVYMLPINKLESKIKDLFNKEIEPESFKYNNISYKYIKSLKYFILDKKLEKNTKEINRIIDHIEEKDGRVIISTKEYYTDGIKVYNPVDDKELGLIDNLDGIEDKLISKEYVFKNIDDRYVMVIDFA